MQTRADQARQDVCRFSEHIATLLVEASKARISHLDAHLVGVRDGVVSDEAAMKRCKVPRCSQPRALCALVVVFSYSFHSELC